MFNRVILVGNLTRDIELRYTPSGMAICTTGIAVNHRFKKQDGSQSEETMFIDITLFGRNAEIANQYLKKGSKVLVEGRLKFDSWNDQNGQKRSKHTITVDSLKMIDSKSQDKHEGGNFDEEYRHAAPNTTQNAPKQNIPEIDINEDEIPF
jgi:single-strand DNA-binding protein